MFCCSYTKATRAKVRVGVACVRNSHVERKVNNCSVINCDLMVHIYNSYWH